jgi:hypothetical protein
LRGAQSGIVVRLKRRSPISLVRNPGSSAQVCAIGGSYRKTTLASGAKNAFSTLGFEQGILIQLSGLSDFNIARFGRPDRPKITYDVIFSR